MSEIAKAVTSADVPKTTASDCGTVSAIEIAATPKKETWGLYIYFAADVDNEPMRAAALATLRTIASVGSSDTVKMTAMIDLPGRNTDYYIIPKKPRSGGKRTILPDRFLSNVNTASISALVDFFEWSHRNCPANKIAFIVWGHGYALDDYDPNLAPPDRSVPKPAPTGNQGRTASYPSAASGNELKLLYDYTYRSVLNNSDFVQAIRDITEKLGGDSSISILGLDCCNMAMVEVLSELQGLAKYAVAAESGLPYQSWVTKPLLQKFFSDELTDERSVALSAVDTFTSVMSNSAATYIEMSACELGKMGEVEKAVKAFVDTLLPAIDRYVNRSAIAQAWKNGVSFVPDGLIDLGYFCELLQKNITKRASQRESKLDPVDQGVVDAASVVRKAIDTAVPGHRFAPPFRGTRLAKSTGLTIWFPPWIQFPGVRYFQIQQSKDYFSKGYSQTHFAKVTGWDRFLQKLYSLTQR